MLYGSLDIWWWYTTEVPVISVPVSGRGMLSSQAVRAFVLEVAIKIPDEREPIIKRTGTKY